MLIVSAEATSMTSFCAWGGLSGNNSVSGSLSSVASASSSVGSLVSVEVPASVDSETAAVSDVALSCSV